MNLFDEWYDADVHHEKFVCCEFVLRSYHNSFASRLLVVMCVEPGRWENKVGFPETPLLCLLGKSFDTLLRVMSKTTLSHVKVRVRFSNRWLTEIGGSLTGESYPKLCFG